MPAIRQIVIFLLVQLTCVLPEQIEVVLKVYWK